MKKPTKKNSNLEKIKLNSQLSKSSVNATNIPKLCQFHSKFILRSRTIFFASPVVCSGSNC